MKEKIDKKYLAWFFTLSGVILFYFLIRNLSVFGSFISKIISVLSPVVYGFVIAYILFPMKKFIESIILKLSKNKSNTKAKHILAIVLTYIFALLIVALIVALITTQAISSIDVLIKNSSQYISDFSNWFETELSLLDKFTADNQRLASQIENLKKSFENIISDFINNVLSIIPRAFSFVDSFATKVGSFFIGTVLSVYMLFDKNNLIARIKKMIFAFSGERFGNKVLNFGRDLDDTVGGFITGKLLGSLIAGLLSYIVFLICGFEFPALLAVIIGICDIIPVFGPIIGAIPCGIILLVVAPKQVIPFIIALILIEQVEGNIISPNILSHTTGVSGFWVMVSLTVGGALFGIVGLVLAVPIFAVLYKLFAKLVNFLLDKKGIKKELAYYQAMVPDEKINEKPKITKLFKRKKDKNAK